MRSPNLGLASPSFRDTFTRPCPEEQTISPTNSCISFEKICVHLHAAVKVHSVDSNRRIILDSQINMLANTETKVARFREILLLQFIFLDLQPTFKNLLGFRTADCDVDRDFFVTTNTKCPDGVSGFAW